MYGRTDGRTENLPILQDRCPNTNLKDILHIFPLLGSRSVVLHFVSNLLPRQIRHFLSRNNRLLQELAPLLLSAASVRRRCCSLLLSRRGTKTKEIGTENEIPEKTIDEAMQTTAVDDQVREQQQQQSHRRRCRPTAATSPSIAFSTLFSTVRWQ